MKFVAEINTCAPATPAALEAVSHCATLAGPKLTVMTCPSSLGLGLKFCAITHSKNLYGTFPLKGNYHLRAEWSSLSLKKK